MSELKNILNEEIKAHNELQRKTQDKYFVLFLAKTRLEKELCQQDNVNTDHLSYHQKEDYNRHRYFLMTRIEDFEKSIKTVERLREILKLLVRVKTERMEQCSIIRKIIKERLC